MEERVDNGCAKEQRLRGGGDPRRAGKARPPVFDAVFFSVINSDFFGLFRARAGKCFPDFKGDVSGGQAKEWKRKRKADKNKTTATATTTPNEDSGSLLGVVAMGVRDGVIFI